MRHFLLAVVYSACVAAFFASLLREDARSGLKLGGTIFAIMVGSVFALGWLMNLLSP